MLYLIESKIKWSVNLRHWHRLYHSAEIACRAKQLAWSLGWKKKKGKDTFWSGRYKSIDYIFNLCSLLNFSSSFLIFTPCAQADQHFISNEKGSHPQTSFMKMLHCTGLFLLYTAEEWGIWLWELLKQSTRSAFVLLLFCVIRQSGIPGNTDLFVSCPSQIFI